MIMSKNGQQKILIHNQADCMAAFLSVVVIGSVDERLS